MKPLHDETGEGRLSHARYNLKKGNGGREEMGAGIERERERESQSSGVYLGAFIDSD